MRLVFLLLLSLALGPATPGGARVAGKGPQREQTRHDKFLQDHPESASAHQAYAEYLAEEGNLRAAIVHWRTAQLLEPRNAAIANSLGGGFLRMGKAAESAAEFRRAIALDGGNPAYHYNLANVEFMLRHDLATAWKIDLAEVLRFALAEYREASRLAPDNIEYARSYAETFSGVPDPDWTEAEAAWKHVLALTPRSDFVYLQLARVSLKRGDAEGTRRFLGQIVDTRHDGLKRKLQAKADQLAAPRL
ncbi:MAG: hypothetical protein ABI540_04395 [Spartobacteria bacterium]